MQNIIKCKIKNQSMFNSNIMGSPLPDMVMDVVFESGSGANIEAVPDDIVEAVMAGVEMSTGREAEEVIAGSCLSGISSWLCPLMRVGALLLGDKS